MSLKKYPTTLFWHSSFDMPSSKITKLERLPEKLQKNIDNEYIKLLKELCLSKFDIREYLANNKLNIIAESQVYDLTEQQQRTIKQQYLSFYKSVRKYENISNYYMDLFHDKSPKDASKMYLQIFQAIEQLHHYYNPFLGITLIYY